MRESGQELIGLWIWLKWTEYRTEKVRVRRLGKSRGFSPRYYVTGTTLRTTGPVRMDSRQYVCMVNAIGMQLRDPINSGLSRWRMAVLKQ